MDDAEEPKQSFLVTESKPVKSRRNCIRTAVVIGVLAIFLTIVIILICLSWPSVNSSATGRYSHAAVATDAAPCSEIGRKIMRDQNGSAVDATIATLLCVCVFNPMSCGIGGGFFMIVYDTPRDGSEKIARIFDAREVAPAAATEHMFSNGTSSLFGGKSIAVPGEVRGYYKAWQQFGRLPWKDLFTPTIDLCRKGFHVTWALAKFIQESEDDIRKSYGLSHMFVKEDGSLYKEGDLMKQLPLAATLEKIQNNEDDFYTGSLAQDIVDDIKEAGGIITLDDLKNYQVKQSEVLSMELKDHGYRMLTLPPPSSGILFGLMLRILEGFNLTSTDIDGTARTVEAYHKIVETFKFGYAMRSHLGDPDFVNVTAVVEKLKSYEFADYLRSRINLKHTENISYYNPEFATNYDHGTSQMSLMSPDGGAVSVTTTINSVFGSRIVGNRTGILFNDEMADFVIPGESSSLGKENFIKPGKRPMSSMCPAIFVDKNNNVVLVIGAAGGKQITSAATYVTAHYLWLGKKINAAVDALRLHHQLEPDDLFYEKTMPEGVVKGLAKKGHVMIQHFGTSSVVQLIKSSCHDPQHPEECLTAVCDWRKKGQPSGF